MTGSESNRNNKRMLESLLIAVIIIGLIFWALGQIPLPDPWRSIATLILVVIAIVYLLRFL